MKFSLSSFISSLRNAIGWRRGAYAFGFGSLMVLVMPPFNLFPLLWLCLPALIFLLQGTTSYKQAFATGWCFAFGFFVFGLYWIAASMFVDIRAFWWAVPLSVAGLPAILAIYYGIAAALARRVGMSGVTGAVAFGLLWFLTDYARGHLFTGFPWNLTGYAWSDVLPVLQITSIGGVYLLSLLTSVAACLPAALIDKEKSLRPIFISSLVFFAVIAIGGEIRLHTTHIATTPNVRVRLVQPNTPQSMKWVNSERERNFQTLIDLSSTPSEKPITHIFWPETASTYYLAEDSLRRKQIADAIPAESAVITGVIRRTLNEKGETQFYNSMVAVNGLGRLVAGYDKAHLVPFGEYMPFRKYIPLRTLAASGADFSSGPGAQTVRVQGLPNFSPLICYEAIFPGKVTDKHDRPDFMANLTNDGWYGNTTGPYQHFAIVRVRAIEEGLPLIRVANTGISGVVDPLGHITSRLGIEKQGIIDSDLAQPLPPTFYELWGEIPVWIVFILIVSLAIISHRKKIAA